MSNKEREALKQALLDLLAHDDEIAEAIVVCYRRGLPLRSERERREMEARERAQDAREAVARARMQAVVRAAEAERERIGEGFFGRTVRQGEVFTLPIFAAGARTALDELSRTLAEERAERDAQVQAAIARFEARRGG